MSAESVIDRLLKIHHQELGRSDSMRSPLGSNNVKYNTWYYGVLRQQEGERAEVHVVRRLPVVGQRDGRRADGHLPQGRRRGAGARLLQGARPHLPEAEGRRLRHLHLQRRRAPHRLRREAGGRRPVQLPGRQPQQPRHVNEWAAQLNEVKRDVDEIKQMLKQMQH